MDCGRGRWVEGGGGGQLEGREGYVKALLKKWTAYRGHGAGHPNGTFLGGSGFQWEQLSEGAAHAHCCHLGRRRHRFHHLWRHFEMQSYCE